MSSASSRSSAPDPFAVVLRGALTAVVDAVRGLQAANPVVLVDGRSGAGKTTLVRGLVAGWPLRGRVQVVALDSLYPGWDGLDDGVGIARDTVLMPHARGEIGVWRRWDWDAAEPAEAHAVEPALPLIVEGSGLLTAETAGLADIRVWLDAPAASRKRRALERDGETYRPHWDRWAAQEERHLARDAPESHATHVFRLP
ncbi:MAG: hypothetical protein QM611_05845 [Microbacterium sp.]|uniref:hypothetical protein n=1 Tax=Microbacterium sp. TaxID=51671 RepID=UPI0039E6BB2D